MPFILLLAKRNHRDLSDEGCVLMTAGIMEEDAHLMWMIVVLVDEHQRPLTVWTMESVSRHQHVSLGIFRRGPFRGDELGGKKLRRRLQNLIVIVDHEQVIRSPAIGAGGVRRRVRQIVIVVSGLAAGGKKSRKGISEPKGAKDVH